MEQGLAGDRWSQMGKGVWVDGTRWVIQQLEPGYPIILLFQNSPYLHPTCKVNDVYEEFAIHCQPFRLKFLNIPKCIHYGGNTCIWIPPVYILLYQLVPSAFSAVNDLKSYLIIIYISVPAFLF